ncbi:hypothetical protein ACIHEI_37130 [Kitasatospora sp. NPDC051984]|uniref:hypothetical protein n=1 Tax=Kitasatospora sp. NPDC051984 TaxID=3364059 RepID=UPI0037CACDAF
MLDPDLVTIATGAGGTIVASMITKGAIVARARIAGLFRRGTPDEQTAAINAFDNDARVLAEWARVTDQNAELAAELAGAMDQISQEWARRIVEYVTAHPEALSDFEALAAAATVSNFGVQHNSGSGTFINGTVIGGVHNSYDRELTDALRPE